MVGILKKELNSCTKPQNADLSEIVLDVTCACFTVPSQLCISIDTCKARPGCKGVNILKAQLHL